MVVSRDVIRFWLLALTGPALAGVVLRLAIGETSPLLSTLVIAPAMAAPLLAAVYQERGWGGLKVDLTASFTRPVPTVGWAVLAGAGWFISALGLVALFGAVGLTGGLATTDAALTANLNAVLPASAGDQPTTPLPGFIGLVVIGLVSSAIAGVTINGLFAYGEEYGWRSHLWSAVADQGRAATIGLVGLLWGLWHAPLIVLIGLNYPDHRLVGIVFMTVFTTATSWPMDELRRRTGGAVAPAIFHGAVNGSAGVLVLLAGGSRLLNPPVGLLGAAAMVPPGLALHLANRRRTTPPPPRLS